MLVAVLPVMKLSRTITPRASSTLRPPPWRAALLASSVDVSTSRLPA